ncbi:hypothetical protein DLAC_02963 [Tieghemostelium lacteum]|uniref:Uncharacterized protein n=1 Tax=Tieghemostelium lacteum TaxID=361077 RepID=A0A152A4B3_TIELA|nr:hypothetical protein DLAC_02963 [Tieghemostelium lacteum]|eukprot:KYR00901.1 hypothetical protein DLAC_02963 [Tieghemostelium lacteum]
MAKVDYSILPLYIILGTALTITGGFGVYRMTTDRDIQVKRYNTMQWSREDTPKMVDRKTSIAYFDQIFKGEYLKK